MILFMAPSFPSCPLRSRSRWRLDQTFDETTAVRIDSAAPHWLSRPTVTIRVLINQHASINEVALTRRPGFP